MSQDESRVLGQEQSPDINPEEAAPSPAAGDREPELNELRKIRREKLKALQEAGRNPFLIETWNVTHYSKQIHDDFEEMEGKRVSCAGRMMAHRHMGKASFMDIQDRDGRIQGYVRQDVISPEEYQWF
jgi:lysyl-tRNA synthetase class 2